jgi:lipopolysaccharide transport system ATP-binding protein
MEKGTTKFLGDTSDGIDYYMNSNRRPYNQRLDNITNRTGKGGLRFKEIHFKNKNNDLISEIFSGNLLNVDFEIDITRHVDMPKFRIMFLDYNGVIRFLCNNQFSMKALFDLPDTGKKVLRCTIPEFPLPKGTYMVRLTCFSRGGTEDDIESAAEINVVGGDFFKTGKEQNLKEGVLVKNTFEILE